MPTRAAIARKGTHSGFAVLDLPQLHCLVVGCRQDLAALEEKGEGVSRGVRGGACQASAFSAWPRVPEQGAPAVSHGTVAGSSAPLESHGRPGPGTTGILGAHRGLPLPLPLAVTQMPRVSGRYTLQGSREKEASACQAEHPVAGMEAAGRAGGSHARLTAAICRPCSAHAPPAPEPCGLPGPACPPGPALTMGSNSMLVMLPLAPSRVRTLSSLPESRQTRR